MVLAEAARCLSCRRCIGCGLCLAECDQDAIVYDEHPETVTVSGDAVILTSDGQIFDPTRKRELGYPACLNVITSFEFERLTSPNGPFGGLLVRPFDGDIPTRIGFIQCVGSRDEAIGADYCSVDCCSRTLAQARRAREIAGDVQVKVFHRGLRPIGKRSELELEDLKAEDWVEFTRAAVSSVTEDDETGTVTVTFGSEGDEQTEDFDLLVLAVGIHAKKDFRRLARAGGLKTNKFGFVDFKLAGRLAAASGVCFAGTVCGPAPVERSIVGAIGAAGRSSAGIGSRQPGPSRKNGKPMVFACEYGLKLAGKDTSLIKELQSAGYAVEGTYPFLCYKDGRAAMMQRLDGSSGLVVVGCHKRSHEGLFERLLGLPPGAVRLLGKQDLQDGPANHLAQAIESISGPGPEMAGAARPKTVVILGGGTSGLAAARELLRRGVRVVLADEGSEIGAGLTEAILDEGSEPEAAEGFIETLKQNDGLTVLTGARLDSVERQDAGIKVAIKTAGGTQAFDAGALLVATGAREYVPKEYPITQTEAIMSQREFRKHSADGDAPWKRVVMIQCVGARDKEHPYCSRFCCRQAISNALLHKANKPDCSITILHRGIRVYGFEEELLTEAIEQGVEFVEIDGRPSIEPGSKLKVKGTSRGGKAIAIDCDIAVLSLAHCPDGGHTELAANIGVELDELGFFDAEAGLLNPFGLSAECIFACGFARTPVVAEDAFDEGVGAAGAICRYLGT
jgi:heterodisulfide reductase subunit A-like polyferredoxin